MSHELALVEEPGDEIRAVILDGLRDFNFTEVAPGHQIQTLAVAIRGRVDGSIIGGLWGRTGMGWLTIELIFVPERLRGQRIASRLITIAEEEAVRRACHSAWLETMNANALALYERLGFVRFGELRDFPIGNSRVFLHKRLMGS